MVIRICPSRTVRFCPLSRATMSSSVDGLSTFLTYSLNNLESAFLRIPGSAVVVRYVKSSHQNDPGRTVLELILVAFAIFTLLQSRTRADRNGKHFIQFNEKVVVVLRIEDIKTETWQEIDELVDEWTPEPLAAPLDAIEASDLAAVPIVVGQNGPKPTLVKQPSKIIANLASYNFTGLAGKEIIKERAIETLRKYGLGSCGPPGFYGTLDVHMQLERDLADFLGAEAAIIYSQGFSTISSVIPAFCKRGDIIVADRGVNFAIQKGIQISRSTVRWYDHNDLKSLEDVLDSVEKERKKRRGPLTRRFIITEGIFEKDGAMTDLPKLIEIKYRKKYRLILDESISFGTVGRTGRGLTELYNVPAAKVDMLVGSMAIGLCAGGGFCAGSQNVIDHQQINGPSFVFSASMPALLAVSASEGIEILRSSPSILTKLQQNVRAARALLDDLDCISIPSHPASPIIHLHVRSKSGAGGGLLHPASAATVSAKPSNPASVLPRDASKWDWDINAEERALQQVVDEALKRGVMITRAKRLRGQEMVEARPSIRLALTSELSADEVKKAVKIVCQALKDVLRK
ncbi:Serine palmitoyltransferase 1 [Mycena venus]|uniref:serine C-palmitoyltransferase n=1 Tax=Mycena venus TaxID=2733690 RepID=A0A8H7CCB6_9AGAR|nr:Serine palmitoyltransferase 1 [Mycena venus]